MRKAIPLTISILAILGATIFIITIIIDYLENLYTPTKTVIGGLFVLISIVQFIGGILILRKELNGYRIIFYIALIKSIAFSIYDFTYLFTTEPVIALKYDSFNGPKVGIDFSIYQVTFIASWAPNSFFFTLNLFNILIASYCFYILGSKRFSI